jgi:hypothetical protein
LLAGLLGVLGGGKRPNQADAGADALLAGVAALGGTKVRDKFSTLTGTQLAEGMVALAMQSRDGKVVADVADIRAALGAGR